MLIGQILDVKVKFNLARRRNNNMFHFIFRCIFVIQFATSLAKADKGELNELKDVIALKNGGIAINFKDDGPRYLIITNNARYLSNHGAILELDGNTTTGLASRHLSIGFDPVDENGRKFKVSRTTDLRSFGKGLLKETFTVENNQGKIDFSECAKEEVMDFNGSEKNSPQNMGHANTRTSESLPEAPILERTIRYKWWFILVILIITAVFFASKRKTQ